MAFGVRISHVLCWHRMPNSNFEIYHGFRSHPGCESHDKFQNLPGKMQLIAHQGPNYGRHVTAVRKGDGAIAVGVGRTIVVYSKEGEFEGELRTVGRGQTTCVAFCDGTKKHEHLLLSSTTERNIRLIDLEARRIVQTFPENSMPRTHRVAYVNMVAQTNVVIVLLEPVYPNRQSLNAMAMCFNASTVKLVDRHIIHGLETITKVVQRNQITFVSGSGSGGGRVTGLVYALQLAPAEQDRGTLTITSQTLYKKEQVVLDFSMGCRSKTEIASQFNGDGKEENATGVLIAVLHGFDGIPNFYYTGNELDEWKPMVMEKHVSHNAPPSHKNSRFIVCCEWISDNVVITSDAPGSLYMWHVDVKSNQAEKSILYIRNHAHTRQVLNIHTMIGHDMCLSTSMDKTMAMWRMMGMKQDIPCLALCWRTLRTTGAVTAVGGDEDGIVYGCEQGTLTRVGKDKSVWDTNVASEGTVNEAGKRMRSRHINSLIGIDNEQTLFKTCDGEVGVLKWNADSRVKVSVCKLGNKQRRANKQVSSMHGDLALVESKGKGKKDIIEVWQLGTNKNNNNDNKSNCFGWMKVGTLCNIGHNHFVSSCEFNVGQRHGIAIGTHSGQITIWVRQDQVHFYSISDVNEEYYGKSMDCICVSDDTHDGGVLAVCDSDSNLIIHWFDGDRLQTRARTVKQLGNQSKVTRMAWNPTSSRCYENGAHPCSNGRDTCEAVTMTSTMTKYLVTVHANDQVLVWTVGLCRNDDDDGRGGVGDRIDLGQRGTIKEHFGAVRAVSWTNSSHVVTGGQDGSVRHYDVTRLPQPSRKNG